MIRLPVTRASFARPHPIAGPAFVLLLAAVLLVRPAAVLPARAAAQPSGHSSATTVAAVDELKRQGIYGSLMAAVRDAEYTIGPYAGKAGGYTASNAAQGLQAQFGRQAVEITASGKQPGPASSLRLRLVGWKRGDQDQALSPARLQATGQRAEYRRGAVMEWYENREAGLEQGFTVADTAPIQHPKGRHPERSEGSQRKVEILHSVQDDEGGVQEGGVPISTATPPHSHTHSLTLTLAVEGAYRVRVAGDGKAAAFTAEGGGPAFSYGGLQAWDARGKPLSARMGLRGRALELRVVDAGAVYPISIDPLLTTVTKITPSDAAGGDTFGASVALSGTAALVGAAGRNGSRGAAYFFTRSSSGWTQQTTLTAADAAAGDTFGQSVALSGETALVGAPGKNGGAGVAYVFVGAGSAWSQQQKLTASDAVAFDSFGYSVALSGETALAGAYGKSSNTGAAYVFIRSGGTWSQQAKLTASDAAAADYFGSSVALSGDTALAGASGKNSSTGAAYVFSRTGTGWSQQGKLTAADGAANDLFGAAVALSGNTALAGAYNKTSAAGAAYVFVRSASVWSQQQKLLPADAAVDDRFGASVALSGETALVGAYGKDSFTGAAYAFVRSGTVWSQQAKLSATDGAASDLFGAAVALSGNTALAGAYNKNGAAGAGYAANVVIGQYELTVPGSSQLGDSVALSGSTALVSDPENSSTGAAYVFVRSGALWKQQQRLAAADAAAGDEFGSVALSGDTALVGAFEKNDAAGAAYVFTRAGSTWSQQQKLTASDAASGDWFGYSVALSGETALVGAYGKNGRTGAAYVFVRTGAAWSEVQELTASDGVPADEFGSAVAVSTDAALVGAAEKNGSRGGVYFFERSPDVTPWTERQTLIPADPAASDYFGSSVALSGKTALVGAGGKDFSAGAAYVFVQGGRYWGQQQKLTGSGAGGDVFGTSVALSGDSALVGASSYSGSAYFFTRTGSVWSQRRELISADIAANDLFGWSVAISGDTALAGARQKFSTHGAAYAFELAPYAPIALAARAAAPTEVDLSWTDTSGIETGFEIERSVDGSLWTLIGLADADGPTGTDGSVNPATLYFYRVRAVNGADPGEWSNVTTVTTLDDGGGSGPPAPTGLAATALSPTQVRLTWTDTSNNETGFEIQRTVTNSQIWTPVGATPGNVTLAFDNDAKPATAYTYRVRSFNTLASSAWVAGATVTTPGPPALPTNLAALALSATQIRLSWTDTSSNETGFEIQRAVNNSQLWDTIAITTGNVTLAFDNDVKPNTPYSYRMRSVNNYGGSLWTVAALVTTPSGLPAAPTGLTATAISAAQINLSFTDASNNETSFEIQVHAGNEPWNLLGTLDANVHTASDLGLTAATLYSYRVRAVNGTGASAWSAVATSTTQNGGSSGLALHARAGKGKRIQLTWKAKGREHRSATVERKEGKATGAGRFAAVGSTVPRAGEWVDRQVKAGVTYTYRLRRGAGAQAVYSNAASAQAARR